jgi:hypothetical protein
MLLISFSLEFHKNLTSVLLHNTLIIYYTIFCSTFSHESLVLIFFIPSSDRSHRAFSIPLWYTLPQQHKQPVASCDTLSDEELP